MKLLTLDLGTTFFKAALFDRSGTLVAVERIATPTESPRSGWQEIPDLNFERTVRELLGRLRSSSRDGFDDVAAVSFATQTNTFRLVGVDGRPWCPMVVWTDERAIGEPIAEVVGKVPGFAQRTGVPEINGQFLPAHLIQWSRTNPRYNEVRKVSLISDVLTDWFTGQHVTEAGAAGLTGMVDIHRLQWIDEMLSLVKLPKDRFPRIERAGTDLGPIRPEVADEIGLPRTCRFVVGCLDQYAGAIGAGNVFPGGISETTGTVLATVRCADRFLDHSAPGVFQGPGVSAERCYHMTFGSISANLLEAYRNALPDKPDYEQLTRLAERVPTGADGLRLRPDARPDRIDQAFDGPIARTRGHEVRAILEGVAAALDQQIRTLCADDDRPKQIRSCGGAARSDLWLQIKANQTGVATTAIDCPEPTSLGAAMLAASALGWGSLESLAQSWVRPRRTFAPER